MNKTIPPRIEHNTENTTNDSIFQCNNCNVKPSDMIFDVIDTIDTENDVISLCEECLEMFWNSAKREVEVDEVY